MSESVSEKSLRFGIVQILGLVTYWIQMWTDVQSIAQLQHRFAGHWQVLQQWMKKSEWKRQTAAGRAAGSTPRPAGTAATDVGTDAAQRRYFPSYGYHSPLVLPAPTSSLKYGNAEPSEFHSTTALAAWVAKWPPGQMGVDDIFTIHSGAGVDTGQQVNLSIRRPFLEKIDSSAPSRSREGKVVAEAATALGEPPSNILDLEQAQGHHITSVYNTYINSF